MSILLRKGMIAFFLVIAYALFCFASGRSISPLLAAIATLVFMSFDYIVSFFCFAYLLLAEEKRTEDGSDDYTY